MNKNELPTPDREQKALALACIREIGIHDYDPEDLDQGLQSDHAWMIFDELCMDIYTKDGGKFHDGNPPMPMDEKQWEGCVLTARHFIVTTNPNWRREDGRMVEKKYTK